MAFDLQKVNFAQAAEAGFTFNLKLPNGSDSGAKLTILGDMAPAVKLYQRKKGQEYLQRQAMLKRKGKEEEIDLDNLEEQAVEACLVRLIGWEGVEEGGKAVAFSKEAAREKLLGLEWVRQQILDEAADVSNFTPKALKP